jgi:hypothetical protein
VKITRTILFSAALLSTLGAGLTGCAIENVPDGGQVKTETQELVFMESPNSTIKYENEAGEPVLIAGDNWAQLVSGDIELALQGSSSCPPAVEKVFKEEPATVKVTLKKQESDKACTMDYRSFFVTVADAGEVKKVKISSNSDENTKELPKR